MAAGNAAPDAALMLERLKTLLPGEDDALLIELLDQARDYALSFTHRRALPEALMSCVLAIAVVLFNRRGMEGETSHAEGSVRREASGMPEVVTAQLKAWRLAGTVRA